MMTKMIPSARLHKRVFAFLLVLLLCGQPFSPRSFAWWDIPEDQDFYWDHEIETEEEEDPLTCRPGSVPTAKSVTISGNTLRQRCNEQGDWGYWPAENLPRENILLLPHGSAAIVEQYRSAGGKRYRFDNSATKTDQSHVIPLASEEEFRSFLDNFVPHAAHVSVCEISDNASTCQAPVALPPPDRCKYGVNWEVAWKAGVPVACRSSCGYYEMWDAKLYRCIPDWSKLFGGCGIACG